jgi:SAM-dependent methyltransferase
MKIKALFPSYFKNKEVLDIGGADINGSAKFLFKNCYYKVLDIWDGPGVDMIGKVTDLPNSECDDVVCYLEVAEHDEEYEKSILGAIRRLKPGGLFLFSCASTGRAEHGTKRTTPGCSPFTTDYYKNITKEDLTNIVGFSDAWHYSEFKVDGTDLYFFGFKKGGFFKSCCLYSKFRPSLFRFIKSYFQYWFVCLKKDSRNKYGKVKTRQEKVINYYRVFKKSKGL